MEMVRTTSDKTVRWLAVPVFFMLMLQPVFGIPLAVFYAAYLAVRKERSIALLLGGATLLMIVALVVGLPASVEYSHTATDPVAVQP